MTEINWMKAIEFASPHPYVLVTTVDRGGAPNIIGISWWTIVSWSPQMMLISVGHGKKTSENLEQVKEFVVNFPSEGQAKGAWICGTKTGAKIDKFKETGFKPLPAKIVKPPLIEGAVLAYECKVTSEVTTGDHRLYIADVVAIHGTEGAPRHLMSMRYDTMVSLDHTGYINVSLPYK